MIDLYFTENGCRLLDFIGSKTDKHWTINQFIDVEFRIVGFFEKWFNSGVDRIFFFEWPNGLK